MGPIRFDPGLLFGVLLGSWPRLAGLDGPPLSRGTQTALLFLYFQWVASVVLPWCLLVLALGWSPWWCIVPLGLYAGLITRLCVGWQAVKAGTVVPRRRRLMHPVTRRMCGSVLGALLPVVVAGAFYTAAHQWDIACVGLLVALWACEEQLIETILG
jgi:hypothetical protein